MPNQHSDHQQSIYLNRELTWLAFNERVLFEAQNSQNPLLERIKFLAIVNNNLDEFFMKRIGGLKQQIAAHITGLSIDGRTPKEQIEICYQKISDLEQKINITWLGLQKSLKEEKIEIVRYKDLIRSKQEAMRQYFIDNIYPLITPQAIDPTHPFPFISNLSLNIFIELAYPESNKTSIARIKLPIGQGCQRFINTHHKTRIQLITLEDLILNNLDLLFPNMKILKTGLFRITRNAISEKDSENADDLLDMIEVELQEREFAPIVRMQYSQGFASEHKSFLCAKLALQEQDTVEALSLIQMRDLFEIASLDRGDLLYPAHQPQDNEKLLNEGNVFHAIRRNGPILIQLPYESFTNTVERFLAEACNDPKVLSIKMTIYRTSRNSNIIQHLITASRKGKQVTVVVELKARFDEAANIHWANYLEEAGIHVTYGIVGLKTHAKLIHIVRQDYGGLRRYSHISTGNYHSITARQYADLGILTCDDAIGQDLTELFNYLTTGYTPNRHYHKIFPAPRHMKKALLERIEREIAFAKKGKKTLLRFKTNALEDVDICHALYQASKAGVKIELIVRDSCRLLAGAKGLSENVRVISIVGRFLEHARIYYFYNNGEEEYFIASADLMHRNLDSRVEILLPVEDSKIRQSLQQILEAQLNDPNAWEMQSNGEYVRKPNPNHLPDSQSLQIEWAKRRYKNANRLKLRKTQSIRN